MAGELLAENTVPIINEGSFLDALPYPNALSVADRAERAITEVKAVLGQLSIEYGLEDNDTVDPLIRHGMKSLMDGGNVAAMSRLLAAHYAYHGLTGRETLADAYAVLATAIFDVQPIGTDDSRICIEDMVTQSLLRKGSSDDERGKLELEHDGLRFLVTAQYVAHTIGRRLKEQTLVEPPESGDRPLELDALAIVLNEIYPTLGTSNRNGVPWASPVYAVYNEELTFYWASAKPGRGNSRHSDNIAENPIMAMVLYDSSVPWGKGMGVYFEGSAAEVTDQDEIATACRLRVARASNASHPPEEFAPDKPRSIFRFTPNEGWISGTGSANGYFIDGRKENKLDLESLRSLLAAAKRD